MKPFFLVDFIWASSRWRISSFLRSRSSNLALASSDWCADLDQVKMVVLKLSKKYVRAFFAISSKMQQAMKATRRSFKLGMEAFVKGHSEVIVLRIAFCKCIADGIAQGR